jgi:thioredoxin-related protein
LRRAALNARIDNGTRTSKMEHMKKLFLLLSLSLLAAVSGLQAADASWLTDYDAAAKAAKAEKKNLLVEFTGSDWCPPCMMMKKEVYSSPEFTEYAAKNLVLVEVDFPRDKPQTDAQKKANEALAGKYGIVAFPTVMLFSPKGKELLKLVGYQQGGAKAFIGKIAAAK